MQQPKNLEEMREMIGIFLSTNPESGRLWDLITGLRGPDSPSETPGMGGEEFEKKYRARRERKAKTVEVIRWHAFNGRSGGGARLRSDRKYVIVPPKQKQDHFDRHVIRAAQVLGLEVRIDE